MRGHVTKNTVSVQGFPPEIYTIYIFYKYYLLNISTIIKTFSSWVEKKDNQQFQSLSSILAI